MIFEFQKKRLVRITEKAHETIAEALKLTKKPYVAWSTGKDSTVVLHLLLQHRPKIKVVYLDADCAFPGTTQMLDTLPKQWKFPLIRFKTEPLLKTFQRYGLLHSHLEEMTMKTTVYFPIRALLKQYKFDGVFLGLRAGEAFGRAKLLQSRKKLFFNERDSIWQCLPIGWWTGEDVWNYTELHKIPYHPNYDMNFFEEKEKTRVSYWAGETNRRRGRFVYLKYYFPELFNQLAEICPEARFFV